MSLRLEDVRVSYGGNIAVAGFSASFEPGRVSTLIGPNGAGKSTVLGVACGLRRPDRGRIYLDGREFRAGCAHELAAAGVRRTFQTVRPVPGLTVFENVVVGTHADRRITLLDDLLDTPRRRRIQQEHRERALAVLGEVGIAHHADAAVSTLSYGQLRLMELARALIADPTVLLLDEPAAGLTLGAVEQFAEIVRHLAASGRTVVLVEHNLDLVRLVSDDLYVLHFGELIAQGEPAEVMNDPQVLDAYTGIAPR